MGLKKPMHSIVVLLFASYFDLSLKFDAPRPQSMLVSSPRVLHVAASQASHATSSSAKHHNFLSGHSDLLRSLISRANVDFKAFRDK